LIKHQKRGGEAMSLGERIKERRKEKRLTQKKLADLLGGIDDSTISKWESNIYEPDANTINKLSEIFSVSADYLISGQEKAVEKTSTAFHDFDNLSEEEKEYLETQLDIFRKFKEKK
jgi:transcriptional regulator with XRE-family HTH domain